MGKKLPITTIISFLLGQGVAGVLGHLGQTVGGLIVSIISIVLALGLAVWWLLTERKKFKEDITTQSIRRDINRQIWVKTILWFAVFAFVAISITIGMQVYIHTQSTHPTLTLDTVIKSVTLDTKSQSVNVTWDFIVNNNSDAPAYQNRLMFAVAPLGKPERATVMPDAIQMNPIYKGTKNQVPMNIDIGISDGFKGNQAVVITRTTLSYADATNGWIRWYEETWWWALTVWFSEDGNPKRAEMLAVAPNLKPEYDAQMNRAGGGM